MQHSTVCVVMVPPAPPLDLKYFLLFSLTRLRGLGNGSPASLILKTGIEMICDSPKGISEDCEEDYEESEGELKEHKSVHS